MQVRVKVSYLVSILKIGSLVTTLGPSVQRCDQYWVYWVIFPNPIGENCNKIKICLMSIYLDPDLFVGVLFHRS